MAATRRRLDKAGARDVQNSRVSLKDIAAATGFSIFTVSKVLNGLGSEARISKATCETIGAAAKRLNYRPSAAARSIRSNRTNWIGILIRNTPESPLNYPMAYEIILGIDDLLCRAGYATTLVRVSDVASMRAESRAFREHMLDGMIVMDQLPAAVHRHVAGAVPTCLWVESNVWRSTNCLRRDDAGVGRGVARQAKARGYRRLIVPRNPIRGDHYAMYLRHAAMIEEARRLELKVIPRAGCDDAAWHPLVNQLQPDTAVVTSGSWDAEPLARRAAAYGKVAGRDYGMVSTDEDQHLRLYWPELSRYAFDRFGLGQTAAAMLLELLQDGAIVNVPSRRIESPWIPGKTLPEV